MMRKLLRNLLTAIRSPINILLFSKYQLSRSLNNGSAFLKITPNVRIGGFIDYSEYKSTRDNISAAELAFFKGLTLPVGDIMDVGANIGTISIVLARSFPQKTIHAFEPNPNTIASLTRNISENRIGNIKICPMAASSITGQNGFISTPKARATARLADPGEKALLTTETIRLDDYCSGNDIATIAFLKIDVEGFEADVLSGATGILKSSPPHIIYYEVCPGNCIMRGKDPMEATSLLINQGYRIFSLDPYGKLVNMNRPAAINVSLTNWIAMK